MSLPPTQSLLENLGGRPFSFYPPIVNIEQNEWRFLRATWSEVLVLNPSTGTEVWVPRRFLGEISRVDEPVVIIGLQRELEFKGGAIWPYQRRVIEMPMAVGAPPRTMSADGPVAVPAPVIGIRMESSESRIGRLIGTALLIAILICVATVAVYRGGVLRPRVSFTAKDQSYLELNQTDDYYSIVRKLGAPSEDRWRSETGELQFRGLWYPERSYVVILMGTDRKAATYIGVMGKDWKPIHSVPIRTGGDTASMLRGLGKF